MKKFDIALKIKAKHGIINDYLIENKITCKKLSNMVGIGYLTMLKILNFKWIPSNNYRSIDTKNKLESFFCCSIEELFPDGIITILKNNEEIRKLLQEEKIIRRDIEEISLSNNSNMNQILTYEQNYNDFEISEALIYACNKLSDKDRTVIEMRFGLGDWSSSHTLEELEPVFKLTRERIRQIEVHAIEKLKKYMKDFK